MQDSFDVIVIGLGAMGSAATYQLARAGAAVLGIDRFHPPHTHGSSHGDTRITRVSGGEGAPCIPLGQRALQLWRDIERDSGAELFGQCGWLAAGMSRGAGPADSKIGGWFDQTVDLGRQFGVTHEKFTPAELAARFPQFSFSGQESGYFEPEAGFLRPERCVAAQLELAARYGATLQCGRQVTGYRDNGSSVEVTVDGKSYTASTLIVAAGPWIGRLLPEYAETFSVLRQVQYWFALRDPQQYPQYRDLPVYIWQFGDGPADYIYGFPALDGPRGGVKIATEDYTATVDPDNVPRTVSDAEADAMYGHYIRDNFPGLSRTVVRTATCLYTATKDFKFVIDRHPAHSNVIVASPCSGMGFKFSAAIGETLAQLATHGRTDIDISAFGLDRLLA